MVKKETKKIQAKTIHTVVKAERYVEGIGGRKTSVARVRIVGGHGKFMVNSKELKQYFHVARLLAAAEAPLAKLKLVGKYDVSAKVKGGGIKAQAEAVRLGLARALAETDKDFQVRLHGFGYLTRDSRMVERKKYGLKKARRAPQWAKR